MSRRHRRLPHSSSPRPPRPPAAAVSRKEATVSPTAVDGGKQRTANLLLCACYQIRQAGSFINETNVGHPRQANTRGRKATPPPSSGLFAFFKRGFERKKSYSISCAPPSSCCVQSPPASLPLPPRALFLPPRSPPRPLLSPDPPLAAHFEDEKTQDISSQRECFEFHVLRRPAAPNNGALFCGLFFPTARSHYQLSGLSSYNLK